jgi:mono/diheme cytochrome c family protein
MTRKLFKYLSLTFVLLIVFRTYGFIKRQGKTRVFSSEFNDTAKRNTGFGFGRRATLAEIARWDIAIQPDGKCLPQGSGNVQSGKIIYINKCAACHGATGIENAAVKLPAPALVSDSLTKSKAKTIGNYWPYATTVFDYIRRTMPYNAPGSLTNNEVYSVTAYLLNANRLINANAEINAKTLPLVKMPARKLFVPDDRKGGPEVK